MVPVRAETPRIFHAIAVVNSSVQPEAQLPSHIDVYDPL
jgi:hypothetical protein